MHGFVERASTFSVRLSSPSFMSFVLRFFCILTLTANVAVRAKPIDYGRDVRPIIAENCFHCHGQDAGTRKGKLRLDTRQGQKKSGVIVPGVPDDSELIGRILSDDPEERMPPEESHRTLTEAQKATLTQWIAEGAPFEEHWAFTAPEKPETLPAVKNANWVRSPIDHF